MLAALLFVGPGDTSLIGTPAAVAKEKKRQGVFERLFRPRGEPPEARGQSPQTRVQRSLPPRTSASTRRAPPPAEGFRTLCVRSCDGYYFPISNSASRKRFKIDEAVCKATYAGADADLFVHPASSSADTAVSLAGRPLADAPNAFAYRHTFDESCHSQLKRGMNLLTAAFVAKAAGRLAAATEAGAAHEPLVPDPLARAYSGNDPETASNKVGGFDVLSLATPEDPALMVARMRKVGPDYYYVRPEAARIDTLSDPPTQGPMFSLIGSAYAEE